MPTRQLINAFEASSAKDISRFMLLLFIDKRRRVRESIKYNLMISHKAFSKN